MKTTDKFTYKSAFGIEYPNCHFYAGRYHNNGNLALAIEDDEDEICVCTVNGNRLNKAWEIGVKNYSENEGMVEFLKNMGIIENNPIDIESSGWVDIPYFKLTESGKELYKELLDKELCRKAA